MRAVFSVTRRHVEFLSGEGDHQLPSPDDDHVGEEVE
jgi:hypothetical protein